MASSPGMKIIQPIKLWSSLVALSGVLLAVSVFLIFDLSRKSQQDLVRAQSEILVRARIDDLRSRRYRNFVEGIGSQFPDVMLEVKAGNQVFVHGQFDRNALCHSQALESEGDEIQLNICRKHEISMWPFWGICSAFIAISYLTLRRVRAAETHATTALIKFFSDQGVQPKGTQSLSGIMESLNDLTGELRDANSRLIRLGRLEVLTDVATQVAHDIRSPLSALKSIATSKQLDAVSKQKTLISVSDRISAIAEGLLEVAKNPSAWSRHSSPFVPVNVASLVENVVGETRLKWATRTEIEIVSNVSDDSIWVLSSREGLFRALSNLINNGIEAIHGEGFVQIETARSERSAIIKIVDNGRGMNRDELARLGERGGTFGKLGGNGLGVYGARKFVEECDGRLTVESEVGVGSSFSISLPLIDSPTPAADTAIMSTDCILIDDDIFVREAWEISAGETGIIVTTFESIAAFWGAADHINKATPIFIDSDLGAGERGEFEAKRMKESGFVFVYLATGYSPDDFKEMKWLDGVVGKDFPADLIMRMRKKVIRSTPD